MPAVTQRALRTAIDSGKFDHPPVYYLHGDEDFRKEEAIRRLIDSTVDPATREFNLDVRRGAAVDAGELGSLLGAPPMMADRRMIVVRDVSAMKKGARETLDRYLEQPASDMVLVLSDPAGVKADKHLLAIASAVEFGPLKPDQVVKWAVQHAVDVHGMTLTTAAAELLESATQGDLAQVATELEKLASFAADGRIDESAVTEVVGVRRGDTLSDLLDRIAYRDGAGAIEMLPRVIAQPRVSGVSVVMALAVQTLAMAYARVLMDSGRATRGVGGSLYELLKQTGAFPNRPWGEAVKTWSAAAKNWQQDELDVALEALAAADAMLKETRVSSEEQVLATLILKMCGTKERVAA